MAAKRAYPEAIDIEVDGDNINIWDSEHRFDNHWIATSDKVSEFVKNFDAGNHVEPFSVELEFKEFE